MSKGPILKCRTVDFWNDQKRFCRRTKNIRYIERYRDIEKFCGTLVVFLFRIMEIYLLL